MSGELCTDPEREGPADAHATGIYVRARNSAGFWINADIAQLDRHSLLTWLNTGELLEQRNRAFGVVFHLLDHETLDAEERRLSELTKGER